MNARRYALSYALCVMLVTASSCALLRDAPARRLPAATVETIWQADGRCDVRIRYDSPSGGRPTVVWEGAPLAVCQASDAPSSPSAYN